MHISPYIVEVIMAKKCELTGKNPMKGHNVSHANNKTKRRFLPNLKKVKFTSTLLKIHQNYLFYRQTLHRHYLQLILNFCSSIH